MPARASIQTLASQMMDQAWGLGRCSLPNGGHSCFRHRLVTEKVGFVSILTLVAKQHESTSYTVLTGQSTSLTTFIETENFNSTSFIGRKWGCNAEDYQRVRTCRGPIEIEFRCH